MAASREPELRLAVVVPGAVSLGAYEAGALTALLRLIRAADGRIAVDAIVGASAGSIAAVVLAHAVLTGRGDGDLEDLWVRRASIGALLAGRDRSDRPRAPLSAARLRDWAVERLDGRGIPADAAPVAAVFSIANLRGLRYRIAQPEAGTSLPADTFRDAKALLLGPGTDWTEAIDVAIASAANAFAFAPAELERRREEYPATIEFPGERASLWYTDGGTVYNVPIGFAMDAVFDPDALLLPPRPAGGRRLFLLLHPHPTAPPERWPEDGGRPTFRATGSRAFSLATAQTLYDDLREMEKTNTRIRARERLEALLAGGPPDRADLAAAAQAVWERKREIRALLGRDTGAERVEDALGRAGAEATGEELLSFLLDEATGTRGKHVARLEVISPELGAGGRPVTDLLAGEKLLHFFGFALRAARESDFALGYRNVRSWWDGFRNAEAPDAPDLPSHPLEAVPSAGELDVADIGRFRRFVLAARLGIRYLGALLGR